MFILNIVIKYTERLKDAYSDQCLRALASLIDMQEMHAPLFDYSINNFNFLIMI